MFLFQFVGFVQVNNLKQTLNRRVFTVHRFSIIILKFLGSCYFALQAGHLSKRDS